MKRPKDLFATTDTEAPFSLGEPVSEANPLPVSDDPDRPFALGEPITKDNPLPVTVDPDHPFNVGEPISRTNPLPVTLVFSERGQIGEAITKFSRALLRQASNWALSIGSPPSEVPANINAPLIFGDAIVGETLTATHGTWSGSPITYARQWYRDGNPIEDAIWSTYVLTEDDIGAEITIGVIATNGIGDSDEKLSLAVGPVEDVEPEIELGALSGSFTLAENAALGALAGTLTGKTSGSTLTLVSNAGGRVSLDGTSIKRGATELDYETSTSHSFTIRETLEGAVNSPRDTVLTLYVTDIDESTPEPELPVPGLALAVDVDTYPPAFDIDLPVEVLTTDYIRLQGSANEGFTNLVLNEAVEVGTGAITVPGLADLTTTALRWFRARIERGEYVGPWTTVVTHGQSLPVPLTKLLAIGDSITVAEASYANRYAAARPSLDFANRAWGGWGINNLMDNIATIMAQEDPSHVTILIGANDLPAADVEDWLDDLHELVDTIRSIKPEAVIGVCGVLPLDESLPNHSGFNAKRDIVNATLRTAGWIDFYIPLGDHSLFTDDATTKSELSSDGVHWDGSTSKGYDAMLEVYAAVMDPIAAEAAGATPTQFEFTDVYDALAETEFTSAIIVTGMGMNRTATASGSGDGSFRRGRNAWGTSSFPVLNGDQVWAKVSTSATPNEVRSQAVTIGGVTDALDAETANDLPELVTTFRSIGGPSSSWTMGTSPQFPNPVQYYAGRNIIAIFTDAWWEHFPTKITLDGVDAEPVAEYHKGSGLSHCVQFYMVDMPSDGTGTLKLTTGEFCRGHAYALWSTSADAEIADVKFMALAEGAGSPKAAGSIAMPAGGSILYVMSMYPHDREVVATTGCTELGQVAVTVADTSAIFFVGKRDTTGECGVAWTGPPLSNWANPQILSIALKPGSGE